MKRPAHGAFNGKGGSSSSSFAKLCGGSFRVGSGISPQKTRTFFGFLRRKSVRKGFVLLWNVIVKFLAFHAG